MIIEIILAILLGIIAGTITGLIPGIHINLIGAFLISLSASVLLQINSTYFVIFIVAMAITHTFIDFIPSIILGCPDTDTELSILPGHKLLKQGKAYEAILLTAYGSLAAIIILVVLFYPSFLLIKFAHNAIETILPYILIATSIFLIFLEKKKVKALIVFLITGILGYLVLSPLEITQPLLPLLTGLFGSSTLIMSIQNKTKIPKQEITKPKVKLKKPLLGAFLASPLCSFLPGLGSGQAAVIGNVISRQNNKGFLVLLGATNTFVMGFSFLALFAISRTRTGAAAAIKEILPTFSNNILFLIIIIILISGILSFFLVKKISKYLVHKVQKVNYIWLATGTIVFLTILVTFISGWKGLLVLITATITGLYCISLGVRRTNMMGCLLLPVIIFYLF